MIDTGMTRSGVSIEKLDALLQTIAAHPALRWVGLCTHFANADDPASDFTNEQAQRFHRDSARPLAQAKVRPIRHAANSGAMFFFPKTHFDMVRPGISLYGIDPTGRPCLDRPLRPAMKWTAPLITIRELKKGAGVGYGQTWHAPRNSRIGLVPVGYADGYLRCFSNRAVMLVHGKPAPVVGRVSMDLTTIDLTDCPQAIVGDEVTILDDDPLSPCSAYKLAEWADTIPYEIFCRIGPRVHRVPLEPQGAPSNEGEQQSPFGKSAAS
jgi:alanine racemase